MDLKTKKMYFTAMIEKIKSMNPDSKEVFFQIFLHILLFLSFSFDSRNPGIEPYHIPFFVNYAIGALIINYVLIPRLFYRKKYLLFMLAAAVVVSSIMLFEEFVLEKIYFADSKGLRFQGFVYGLLDVMPFVIILSGFKFAWDAAVKQTQLEKMENMARESELQFLKSQINPHFLFNNLNNLYSYALQNSEKTPTIILELSSVLRYMLYDCREKYVPVNKEIEQLQNYSRLYEMQVEGRGRVKFLAENSSTGYVIAPLILTVFLENAFKHSTASQTRDICIDIGIRINQCGELHFQCVNTHNPQTNVGDMPHGIGLRNVRKRLDILYPKSHELMIENEENTFSVDLSLKLKKESS